MNVKRYLLLEKATGQDASAVGLAMADTVATIVHEGTCPPSPLISMPAMRSVPCGRSGRPNRMYPKEQM